MTDANRTRVFMDTGDEAGIENQLHVGHGGHNYAYWVSNFEMYLKWMTKDW